MDIIERLGQLDKTYEVLPFCACVSGSKRRGNFSVTWVKTYPPYPWRPGTGDHIDDDPVKFIDECAQAGLVKWKLPDQRRDEDA